MRTPDSKDGFTLPYELQRSAPRPVKLSRRGRFVFGLAILFFAGAVAAGVGLGSEAAKGVADSRRFAAESAVAEGVVLAKWQSRSDSSRRWITYRFATGGTRREGRSQMQRTPWRNLDPGSEVLVRYLPSDPGRNRAEGAEPSGVPVVVPIFVSAQLVLLSAMLLWQISVQRRLLEDGRPARGTVTEHGRMRRSSHGRQTGKRFKYTFTLLGGGTAAHGRGGPEMAPPAIGGSLVILYAPDNPRRNAPYPLPFVTIDLD
jgi:hypothetical protein